MSLMNPNKTSQKCGSKVINYKVLINHRGQIKSDKVARLYFIERKFQFGSKLKNTKMNLVCRLVNSGLPSHISVV